MQANHPESHAPEISLTALPAETGPVLNSLQLLTVQGEVGIAIASSSSGGKPGMTLRSRNFSGQSRQEALVVSQLLHATPMWNARVRESDTLEVVTEKAGGAVNALYRVDAAAEDWISRKYATENFSRPKFVKGWTDHSSPAITALMSKGRVALFVPRENNQYEELQEIACPGIDVLLLYKGPGQPAWLFYKERVPGPVRPPATQRGVLCVLPLGPDMKPIGAMTRPFGQTVIFEFDVFQSPKGVSLLATTEQGILIGLATFVKGTGATSIDTLQLTARTEKTWAGALSSPSLLEVSDTLHFALLETSRDATQRILTCTLSKKTLLERVSN